MDPSERRALEELAGPGDVDGAGGRSLLDRLEGPDAPPPGPREREVLGEAEVLARVLSELEAAFRLAGRRRRRHRASARALGRDLVRRAQAREGGQSVEQIFDGGDAGVRARWEERSRDLGRLAAELNRAVAAAHGAFLADLPPGEPGRADLEEAFRALAENPRPRSRWNAAFGAMEARLEVLEREHLRLRAQALLGRGPSAG